MKLWRGGGSLYYRRAALQKRRAYAHCAVHSAARFVYYSILKFRQIRYITAAKYERDATPLDCANIDFYTDHGAAPRRATGASVKYALSGIFTSDIVRRGVKKSTRIDWAAETIDIGSFHDAESSDESINPAFGDDSESVNIGRH